jgi:DNA-binding MarR family transcriptional regulator
MNSKDKDPMIFLGTMRLLMTHMGPLRTPVGSDLNMTSTHHQTLFYISEHEGCKMTDISTSFSLTPAAVTRTVNNLIEMGLVERYPDEADRRVVRVRKTGKGQETMKKVLHEISTRLGNILGRMDEEDRRALMRGMDALKTALRECMDYTAQ